jgi:hypothetical protein
MKLTYLGARKATSGAQKDMALTLAGAALTVLWRLMGGWPVSEK